MLLHLTVLGLWVWEQLQLYEGRQGIIIEWSTNGDVSASKSP